MNAVSTGPPLGPITRSMWAISGPDPIRASPTMLFKTVFTKFNTSSMSTKEKFIGPYSKEEPVDIEIIRERYETIFFSFVENNKHVIL